MNFGAKIAKTYQGFGRTGVDEYHPLLSPLLSAEILVLGELLKTDHFGTVQRLTIDGPLPLGADQPLSALVGNPASDARIHGQFLGSEILFGTNLAINDPSIQITLRRGISNRDGFQIMVVIE